MNKTQTALAMMFLVLTCSLGIRAQVTIGSESNPNPGSLLDIKEKATIGANSERGLMLPRVNLQSLSTLAASGGIYTDKNAHMGLMVYNLKESGRDLCKGVYIWNGSVWVRLGDKCACEYTITGWQDNKDYHIYCDDFSTISPNLANTKCSGAEFAGSKYSYHLMSDAEYDQIWSEPIKGTSDYKFVEGYEYFIHKKSNDIASSLGWITLGYLFTNGANKLTEVVGWGQRKVHTPTGATFSPGGPSVGGFIEDKAIVRCIRD